MVELCNKSLDECSRFKLFKCFIQLFLLDLLANLCFSFLDLEATLEDLLPSLIALLCACSIFFSRFISYFFSLFFSLAMFLAMVSKPDWVLFTYLLSLVFCFFLRPYYRVSSSFSNFPSRPICDIPPPIPLLKYLKLFLETWYLLASTPS